MAKHLKEDDLTTEELNDINDQIQDDWKAMELSGGFPDMD
jgi:hypothetical protein